MATGPTAFEGGLKVRAFEANDEPGMLDVLQAAFGPWPHDIQGVAPGDFFRWKHLAGPFGPSLLLVAEADDVVIGFAAYMPWRFRARGQILTTMRAVDFAVHPSHRRRGASSALTQTAVRHLSGEVAFTWSNPNEQMRPGSLKSGRRQVGRLPRFVQLRIPEKYTVQLLARTKPPHDRLVTAKDLDYLRWRYGRFKEYRAIRTGARSGASGMVIFRLRRHGSFWVSHVCELFVEQDDRRAARHLLRQVRDAAPADFVTCSFSSHTHAALRGFVPYRGGTVLMTFPLQQNLVPDPTQRASWALSFGDLELL